MGGSVAVQARALLAKSSVYQRRNTATNLCLITAPVFFCGLLAVLQLLANAVVLNKRSMKCGCQCTECCVSFWMLQPLTQDEVARIQAGEVVNPSFIRTEECQPMTTGYCERTRNAVCRAFNESNCGIRYSSPKQAVFCSIKQPSSWPPILHTPYSYLRAGGRSQQWLPFTGTNLTAARAVAANLAIQPELHSLQALADLARRKPIRKDEDIQQWFPAASTTSSALLPIAVMLGTNPAALLTMPPAKIVEMVLPALVPTELVNKEGDSVDAAQVSRLALSFGSALRPTQDYYLERAFAASDSSPVQLLLPAGQCAEKGFSTDLYSTTYPLPELLLSYYNQTYPLLVPPLLRLLNVSSDSLTASLAGSPVADTYGACADLVELELANSTEINRRLYCETGTKEECDKYNEGQYGAALDFTSLGPATLEYNAYYNMSPPSKGSPRNYRIPKLLDLATQAWTRTYWGTQPITYTVRNRLLGLMSFPKLPFTAQMDFSIMLGPLFYTWVIQMLMPTLLQQLVYEKEKRLRVMMKMHGLGDGAYWLVTYLWYLMLYIVYMCFFLSFGTLIRLKIFITNSYSLQVVLYFIFGNNMIAFLFMLSSLFASSRTATIVAFLYIFATGLIGEVLLRPLILDQRSYMLAVQLVPGFALYRGLMEFSEYSLRAIYGNVPGLGWHDLRDPGNGMIEAWVILAAEWPLFMALGWYLEQVLASGTGARRHPLYFLRGLWRKRNPAVQHSNDIIQTDRGSRSGNVFLRALHSSDSSSTSAPFPVVTAVSDTAFSNDSPTRRPSERHARTTPHPIAAESSEEEWRIYTVHSDGCVQQSKGFPTAEGMVQEGQVLIGAADAALSADRHDEGGGGLGCGGGGSGSCINNDRISSKDLAITTVPETVSHTPGPQMSLQNSNDNSAGCMSGSSSSGHVSNDNHSRHDVSCVPCGISQGSYLGKPAELLDRPVVITTVEVVSSSDYVASPCDITLHFQSPRKDAAIDTTAAADVPSVSCPSPASSSGSGSGSGKAAVGISPLTTEFSSSPDATTTTTTPTTTTSNCCPEMIAVDVVSLDMDADDVMAEANRVALFDEQALLSTPLVVRGLAKVFKRGGEGCGCSGGGCGLLGFGHQPQRRVAVRNLTLAIERGECFGLLGPNGAGKTTSINMLTGFLEPSAGDALVEGRSVRTHMQEIYRLMGVCPQHDLLWEQLTGEEHLLFYGRLKGLTGSELSNAVDMALRSVKLHVNNAGSRRVSTYSGGMKRRLSVAISFIGDPKVVYLDEPSTGLDPASRRALWDVVRNNKDGRAIILTTHSMEEAEILCDRLGIFVDGQLVCIGNPREITSRFAGYLVFTITVGPGHEDAARAFVTKMSPNARLTYEVGSTFKYELPTTDVSLSGVFDAMVSAKSTMSVLDWGVANATLEEVFIKFARQIGADTKDG